IDRPRVHSLLPVRVVAIGDQQGYRAPQRAAVPHARADLDGVALDLHAAAAAVAELATRHVSIERPAVELQPGRHPLDDRDQARSVRFAGCREPQTHAGSVDAGARPPRSQGCGAIATRAPRARNGAKGMARGRPPQPWRINRPNRAREPAAKATTIASITRPPR